MFSSINLAWFSYVRGRSRSLSLPPLPRERDPYRPGTSENQATIYQAKTHKYEFEHFIYENKQGFDGINLN